MERPALQKLLEHVRARKIDVIVVYKVDRLTRSLADFAKLVELFDAHSVSFISVTQAFNTTTSMGRLTLNMLLSFAQFEREITGERIRDKVAASKRKGIWMGGAVPLAAQRRERERGVEGALVGASSSKDFAALNSAGRLTFFGDLAPLAGWSSPSDPSLDRKPCSPISRATPIASPSRTPGPSRSTRRA